MANTCLQFTGFVMSFLGWIGLIVATATNEWVFTCKYQMNTCRKMDELEAKGLWADCVISTALYHCITLTQILELPAYIQTSRALMVTASILGLPAVVMVLMSMSCINLGGEPESAKNKRSVLGGILILLTAFCGIVSTVWFPIGAHHEKGLMSFGFSLYSGWVGTALCLLGGCIISCCSVDSPATYTENNRFYYSKQGPAHTGPTSTNHAKSAHVWASGLQIRSDFHSLFSLSFLFQPCFFIAVSLWIVIIKLNSLETRDNRWWRTCTEGFAVQEVFYWFCSYSVI